MHLVKRSLAWGIFGVNRNIGQGAPTLNPMDRAMMVPSASSHPGIAMAMIDPGSGMTHRPVIRHCGHGGVKNVLPAGDGVPGDHGAHTSGRAGEESVAEDRGVVGSGTDWLRHCAGWLRLRNGKLRCLEGRIVRCLR